MLDKGDLLVNKRIENDKKNNNDEEDNLFKSYNNIQC